MQACLQIMATVLNKTEPRKNMVMCYISRLPNDILRLIFCKLPTLSLKQCRYVCKLWQQILIGHEFAKVQLSSTRNPTNLFLCMKGKDLYWLEFEGQRVHFGLAATVKLRPISFFWSPPQFILLNSCNGLLCVCQDYYTMHIINPMTGEYINLGSPENEKPLYPNLCELGFDPKTEKFKVVRLHGRSKLTLDAEVCTLGKGTWRSIRSVPHGNFSIDSLHAFVNGSLHCLCFWGFDQGICAFDFQTENFRRLCLPQIDGIDDPIQYKLTNVGVFRGSLNVSFFHYWSESPLQVWLMKEYGVVESWTKILTMDNAKWYNKDVRNRPDIQLLEDGNSLVHDSENLSLCNSETASYNIILYSSRTENQWTIRPILHSSSFASLKDVVGDSSEVYNMREDSRESKKMKNMWISPLKINPSLFFS